MHLIAILIQGCLIGYVAGAAFPDNMLAFLLCIIANPLLTSAYGILLKSK